MKRAQITESTALYLLLGAAVVAGIAVAASDENGSAPTPAAPTTTTSTSTG